MGAVTVEELVNWQNNNFCRDFEKISGKKIMFQSHGCDCLLTPQAKIQPAGFFWVDITSEQIDVLKSYSHWFCFVRLENGDVVSVAGETIVHLQDNMAAMKYNKSEGNHWQLHFYPDGEGYYRMKVVGGSEALCFVQQMN